MPYFLAFWSNRSTSTVVGAASNAAARRRAAMKSKQGYGTLVSVRRANADDSRLIRKGVWVRRRRNGSSPQFGTVAEKAAVRRQRSRYRSWL